MTLTVKVLLAIALLVSILIPFGAFAAGEKSRGRYKAALAVNSFLFFGTMLVCCLLFFSSNASLQKKPLLQQPTLPPA